MALRGIQEYIARDANNIVRVKDNIYIGLCVSSYYLTILSDCQLPFFLFTNSAYGMCACVEQSSSGNIQVTYYCPGNNVSKQAELRRKHYCRPCHKARGILGTRFYFGH